MTRVRMKIKEGASEEYISGFKDCEKLYKLKIEAMQNKYRGVVMRLTIPHVTQKRYGAIAAKHAQEGLAKINGYLIQHASHVLEPEELYDILDNEERVIIDSIVENILSEC